MPLLFLLAPLSKQSLISLRCWATFPVLRDQEEGKEPIVDIIRKQREGNSPGTIHMDMNSQ